MNQKIPAHTAHSNSLCSQHNAVADTAHTKKANYSKTTQE